MKEKILPFIIGLLVGAIITTGGFLIYQKNNKHQGPQGMNRDKTQMMQRRNENSTDGNTPPSLPNGEKPNEKSQTDNQTQNSSETTNS